MLLKGKFTENEVIHMFHILPKLRGAHIRAGHFLVMERFILAISIFLASIRNDTTVPNFNSIGLQNAWNKPSEVLNCPY